MADQNANKITVHVEVEPTPATARPTQADSSATRAETTGTSRGQLATAEEVCSDARRTWPEEATPDADASGPPIPPDGRWQQQPLSERILTNDLYGMPLYQPSVGPIEPLQTTGARAAAAIIMDTGADPNFITDRVIGRIGKPRRYEMALALCVMCAVPTTAAALGLHDSPLPPKRS